MIELIMVIVITGILAVVAIPRMLDHTFDARGFHDAVKAAVQHARRSAIAGRRYVCVNVVAGAGSAGSVSLSRDTRAADPLAFPVACATLLPLPAPGRGCAANNQVCAPNGVSLTSDLNLFFDPQGRSVTNQGVVQAAALNITFSTESPVTIQPDSGYVQ